MTGETMFVLRPLIYVLLVRKYGTRSWFPWFISLAVDLIGNSMLSATTMSQDSRKDQHFQFSKSEKDEVRNIIDHCTESLYIYPHPTPPQIKDGLYPLEKEK